MSSQSNIDSLFRVRKPIVKRVRHGKTNTDDLQQAPSPTIATPPRSSTQTTPRARTKPSSSTKKPKSQQRLKTPSSSRRLFFSSRKQSPSPSCSSSGLILPIPLPIAINEPQVCTNKKENVKIITPSACTIVKKTLSISKAVSKDNENNNKIITRSTSIARIEKEVGENYDKNITVTATTNDVKTPPLRRLRRRSPRFSTSIITPRRGNDTNQVKGNVQSGSGRAIDYADESGLDELSTLGNPDVDVIGYISDAEEDDKCQVRNDRRITPTNDPLLDHILNAF